MEELTTNRLQEILIDLKERAKRISEAARKCQEMDINQAAIEVPLKMSEIEKLADGIKGQVEAIIGGDVE